MTGETFAARLQRQRLEQRLFGCAPRVNLGRYELRSPLGEGGMGSVYVAHDPQLHRPLAIKVLRSGLDDDARWRARLVGEARALASLSHPNVVQVFEAGEHDGHVFVAMELVDGVSLAQWLVQRRSIAEICAVFVDAGRGLAAAHGAGLVHRDFKPHNVVVDREGRGKVMDFGLAWRLEDESEERCVAIDVRARALTQTGARVGTPAYMSPEQHAGATVGPRSDQWSYCVALFEALCGRLPFEGRDIDELRAQIDAARWKEAAADLPSWIAPIVRRGLEPDPARRFGSMDDLVAAIARGDRSWPRRVAIAATGIALAGGVWLFAWERDHCRGAREHIAGVWTEADRERIVASVSSTGAVEAAARTATILDSYAEDWAAAYTAACTAHRDGAGESTHLDATMTCLMRRRDALGALIDVLVEGDAEVARASVSAALALAPLAPCRDAGTQTQVDDSSELALARPVLDRAEARRVVGDRAGARAELAPLVERCRTVGCGTAMAAAMLASGRVTDDPREVTAQLELAYLTAEESSQWDLASVAATELVRTTGDLAEHGDALAWAAHAEAALRRRGKLPDTKLLTATGSVLEAKGDVDGALDHYRRALEAHDTTIDPDEIDRADTLLRLGHLLVNLGRHAEALERLREAERVLVDARGPDDIEVAHVVGAIGTALLASGDFEAALEHGHRASETITKFLGPDHPSSATSRLNLAQSLELLGRYDEALEHAEAALLVLEAALPAGHPRLGGANAMIGMQLARLGRTDDAIARFERAQVVFEGAFPADHPMIVGNLERVAMAHRQAGRVDRALAIMVTVVDKRARALGEDHPDVARAHANLGLLYGEAGDQQRSIRSLERAVAIHERVESRPTERGEARLQLGQALWKVPGQRARARGIVRAAIEDLRAVGTAAERRLITAEELLREE